MKFKKIIIFLLIIFFLLSSSYFIYKQYFKVSPELPYKTTNIEKRDISQIINSSGTLEIKDTLKIGSLVAGTVKQILVKENDIVKKGQILAIIDNGKDDTEVQAALGQVKNTQAQLDYQEKYFARQQELFKANQISQDYFEQVTKDLEQLKANLITNKATLKKAEIEYKNTRIIAPEDGIIIAILVTEGEAVTVDLDATVLFKLAKDLTKMEAQLNIDESDIGQIKKNQKVNFTVSAYPDKNFEGFITDVSFAPKIINNILSYKASLCVENQNMLLRPGMTVNADIKIAKSKNCLAITTQAFQINNKLIETVAKNLHHKIEFTSKNSIKTLEAKCQQQDAVKNIWLIKDNKFIETPIIIGITDDTYYEIKSGITEQDKIIIDIEETDELKKIYSKIYDSAV
jgi:HlyD family secretion protein